MKSRPRGRPPKPPDQRANVRVMVNLTPDLAARLHELQRAMPGEFGEPASASDVFVTALELLLEARRV